MAPRTLAAIQGGTASKGDVLGVARIAAIQAAKRTAELIPLAHPLPLTRIAVEFSFGSDSVGIEVTAETLGRTGVEMEALTGVAVGLLTVYDMCKVGRSRHAHRRVRLLEKSGGKSGISGWRAAPVGGLVIGAAGVSAAAVTRSIPALRGPLAGHSHSYQFHIDPSSSRFTGMPLALYGYFAASFSSMSTPWPGALPGAGIRP
jgi:cyclic pyranopterin phosphate synthase